MRRTHLIVVLAAGLAALTPASAVGKNLQAMTICGPEACSDVPRDELSIELVEGGGRSLPPAGGEPWYRVRVTVGGGGGHDSWWMVVLPKGGYTGFPDGPGGDLQWGSISPSSAALYRRLAGDLRPFGPTVCGWPGRRRSRHPRLSRSSRPRPTAGGTRSPSPARSGARRCWSAVCVSLYRRRS